jgi:hypothetical protein
MNDTSMRIVNTDYDIVKIYSRNAHTATVTSAGIFMFTLAIIFVGIYVHFLGHFTGIFDGILRAFLTAF